MLNGICTFSVIIALTTFEPFYTHLLLTVRSLKRYIYSRSAPLNLENQIQQGFQIEQLQLTQIPIRD